VLQQNGIAGATGILEYPNLRQREEIELSAEDVQYLKIAQSQIHQIIQSDACPPRVEKKICRNCSYFDLCWVEETE
jgi:CRISPR-associated exonuclease Cas4